MILGIPDLKPREDVKLIIYMAIIENIIIKFIKPSVLKSRPVQSAVLDNSEKSLVSANSDLVVTEVIKAPDQHLKLTLKSPVLAMDGKTYLLEAFAYSPHLATSRSKGSFKKLPVPYFSQLDNSTLRFGPGSRQCNLTSFSMLLAYLRPKLAENIDLTIYSEFESFYGHILDKYGDANDNNAQTSALEELKVKTYFSYTLDIEDIIRSIDKDYPVVLGVAYKKSENIVVATGYDKEHELIYVHDPYGVRLGASDNYNIGENGAYDAYTFDTLRKIWTGNGFKTGWGRIVQSVDDKSSY